MNREKIINKVMIALRLRDEIQDVFKEYGITTIGNDDEVNPYYFQTTDDTDGIICEYYYGVPEKIYTPIGELRIPSTIRIDSTTKKVIHTIENRFGLVQFKEPETTSIGVIGGLYYVTKLPWIPIDLPQECPMKQIVDYINYNDAKYIYSEAVSAYEVM